MCTSSRLAMHQYGVQFVVVEDVALTQYMHTFMASSALVLYLSFSILFRILSLLPFSFVASWANGVSYAVIVVDLHGCVSVTIFDLCTA